MKPYGKDFEGRHLRDYPDKADIEELGLPSRYGKQKSKNRRTSRRFLKKKARKAWRQQIEE